MTEMTDRDALIRYYNISTDAFGRYIAITDANALALLKESLDDTSKYLLSFATSPYGPSDDDTDYLNAARDQVNFIIDLLIADDLEADKLLACLNEADKSTPTEGHMAFAYGYADHESVISTLSHINDDED